MTKVEKIKENSNYLRGTLQDSIKGKITGAIADDDQIILKFHGSYQQDDRDRRKERAEKKLEKLFSFMIRLRIAGGKISASQWVGINKIADKYSTKVIKVTTRQTIQLHGIIKSNLKPTIKEFYEHGLDSIAACGDVNRNVMSSASIAKNAGYDEVYEFSKKISEHLLPHTNAYHEIWLDDEKVSQKESEPLYGKTYLPRKFKIVIAIPPSNDVDLFAHDIGLIAIIEDGILQGFNISVGGGMGATHGNDLTFPRVGDVIGFVKKEEILDAIYDIATIQRDFGNREERALSRFKYTIDSRGIDWFVEEFSKRFSGDLQKTRDFKIEKRGDNFGWDQDYLGNYHFTIFTESGRILDKVKEALAEIAEKNLGNFRCTNNQNITISDIKIENKNAVKNILEKYEIDNKKSPIRLDSIACVALNTCTLALAEGQRYLPSLIDKIEEILKKYQLEKENISIRMTGCPNGCGRPYLAEIGLVGKAPGRYNLHLGGSNLGERLNQIYKENLNEAEILEELDLAFLSYKETRKIDETFGDFSFRTILKKQ